MDRQFCKVLTARPRYDAAATSFIRPSGVVMGRRLLLAVALGAWDLAGCCCSVPPFRSFPFMKMRRGGRFMRVIIYASSPMPISGRKSLLVRAAVAPSARDASSVRPCT